MGVDVVGGIPHFERTMSQGAESVKLLCELAAERGKLVDMHCDEPTTRMSRHIETLAYETQRLGLHGRVNGSHLHQHAQHGQLLREQAAAVDG
jgi:cytosine deaminase